VHYRWTRDTIEGRRPFGRRQRRRGLAIPRSALWCVSVPPERETCEHVCALPYSRPVSTSNRTSGLRRPRRIPSPMVRVHSGSPSMPVCRYCYTALHEYRCEGRVPNSHVIQAASLQVTELAYLRQPVDTAICGRGFASSASTHRSRAQEHTCHWTISHLQTGRKSRTGTI